MPDLLADLLSGASHRVWSASAAVVFLHGPAGLGQLAQHLGEIERATRDMDLGGAFFPNRLHLEQALRTLEAWRSGRCRCTLYPGYLFYDPHKEQAARLVHDLPLPLPALLARVRG